MVLINAVTSEPVSGALVQLPGQEMQFSRSDGSFVFTNLPRAQLAVIVRKPGFFNDQELGCWGTAMFPQIAVPTETDHKPFCVIYDTQEFMIDFRFIDGLAGDKYGNLYDVEFSSTGWSSEGLPAGAQLVDRKHIFVEACQKPVTLSKSIYQGLTCIPRITDRPRESDEKPHSPGNSD
jgi:hypothetical protein